MRTILSVGAGLLLWIPANATAAERHLADFPPFSALAPAGFTCAPEVTVTVRALDEATFIRNQLELQKLIGGLRAILGFECPKTTITNLVVVGEAGGKEVYRGTASGRGGWLLTDLRPAATSELAKQTTLPSVPEKATAAEQLPPEAVSAGSAANQSAQEAAALIQASGEGNLAKVRELLAKGADVNAKRDDGETALLAASRRGKAGVVKELRAKGADVNVRDNLGDTALNIASDKAYQNIVDLLIVSGMTMEQVLRVRGTPSRKETIPPDMELWHYSASAVAFQDGKVSYVELK